MEDVMTGLTTAVQKFLDKEIGYAALKSAYRNAGEGSNTRKIFILGGNDAEMEVIKQLLSQAGQRFVQPKKEWGDHSYSPEDLGLEIYDRQFSQGGPSWTEPRIRDFDLVVFVECRPINFPKNQPALVVDHHGDLASLPASIRQVLDILEPGGFWVSSETRRWVELIAANDAGYIPAMIAFGATPDEVARVRSLDRLAQGIMPAHEVEAERAITAKEVVGRLTIIRMTHSKTATVADRMFGSYDQLLILSGDGEVNFYGDGALCAELKTKFEGWNGGSGLGKAGANAYWGGYPNQEDALAFIQQYLN